MVNVMKENQCVQQYKKIEMMFSLVEESKWERTGSDQTGKGKEKMNGKEHRNGKIKGKRQGKGCKDRTTKEKKRK